MFCNSVPCHRDQGCFMSTMVSWLFCRTRRLIKRSCAPCPDPSCPVPSWHTIGNSDGRKMLRGVIHPQSSSLLFSLPVEIRDMIYPMILSRDTLLHIKREGDDAVGNPNLGHTTCLGPADCAHTITCWPLRGDKQEMKPDYFLPLLQCCRRVSVLPCSIKHG